MVTVMAVSRVTAPCPEADKLSPGYMMAGSSSNRFSLAHYFRDVRSETNKVTWPTRKETLVTTGLVFAMAIVAGLFFVISDMVIHWAVGLVLGFGR